MKPQNTYIAVYFNQKAIVKKPEDLLNFIDKIGFDINENTKSKANHLAKRTERLNHRMEIAPPGIGPRRVYIYNAFADTVEEHDRIFNNKAEEAKAKRREKRNQEITERLTEMKKQKKGWYAVSITFERMKYNERSGDFNNTESTFSGNIVAESGMDAYNKAVNEIEKEHEVTYCPEPYSHYFDYHFLGVKTDDGYSVEKWEQWKNEGVI